MTTPFYHSVQPEPSYRALAYCQDPLACSDLRKRVAQHMYTVLDQAEQQFTTFVLYANQRIITCDALAQDAEKRGISWRQFVGMLRGGYILEWYDTTVHFSLLEHNTSIPSIVCDHPLSVQYHRITLARSRRAWPRTLLDIDAVSEYGMKLLRYILVLRCDLPSGEPLRVTCTYNDLPQGLAAPWRLQVIQISQPQRWQWTPEYSQLMCRCVLS